MKKVTGHLATDKGKYYAVLNLYDTEGKRKVKWHNLDLPDVKGNKRKAQERLIEVLAKYNAGDLYLAENMTPAERERNRIANGLVSDYLLDWVEAHKTNIEDNTYEQYKSYLNLRIVPYFDKLKIKMNELSGDEIQELYHSMLADGLSGTTVQRYHGVLHKALKDAVKRRIIVANPADQVTRPKKEQFIASFYKQLLRKLPRFLFSIQLFRHSLLRKFQSEVLQLQQKHP